MSDNERNVSANSFLIKCYLSHHINHHQSIKQSFTPLIPICPSPWSVEAEPMARELIAKSEINSPKLWKVHQNLDPRRLPSKQTPIKNESFSWLQCSTYDYIERGGICFVFSHSPPLISIRYLLTAVVSEICGASSVQELSMIIHSGNSRNSSHSSNFE
jgi:hypothetical protein